MSTPLRPLQTSSWSAAAARKVSAAAISTRLPSPLSRAESLPMVVVFPTPLTPMNNTTEGAVSSFSDASPTWSISVRICRRQARAAPISLIFSALTRQRSASTAFRVVSTPMSPRIRVSSSSS